MFKDIANFNGFSVGSEYFSKEEATFKIKIERKQFASVIAPIDFCFINTKTHIRSNRMRLGYFGFRDNAKDIVYINSTDDIQRVKDSTIAVLNTDIDYDEYFKDKEEKGYLFPEFDHGIFLNPFRHVIRNLTYETGKSKDDAFLFPTQSRSWIDSLEVENVTADVNYSENLEGFHVVTSNSMNSRFSGIQGRNINATANRYGEVSFLSGITVRCDIINNKMEGTITNNYSKENRRGFAGGLCGSIIINNLSYHYSEYDFYEIDELLETLKTRHSIFSVVTGNIINADITATDFAGGITGYCDYPDAIRMNTFSGKLTAKKTGEYNGGSYFLQLND